MTDYSQDLPKKVAKTIEIEKNYPVIKLLWEVRGILFTKIKELEEEIKKFENSVSADTANPPLKENERNNT